MIDHMPWTHKLLCSNFLFWQIYMNSKSLWCAQLEHLLSSFGLNLIVLWNLISGCMRLLLILQNLKWNFVNIPCHKQPWIIIHNFIILNVKSYLHQSSTLIKILSLYVTMYTGAETLCILKWESILSPTFSTEIYRFLLNHLCVL